VVSDTTFTVDANTKIEGDHHTQLSFSDLKEGLFVEVHATRQSDGSWLATRIKVEDGNDGHGDDDH